MKVAFTGSRNGMTVLQKAHIFSFISKLNNAIFIHGDCVGADEEFGVFAQKYININSSGEIWTYPVEGSLCANSFANFINYRTGHLARNREMVDIADFIIGCPPTDDPQKRGGTWYTLRYAQKANKVGLVFRPTIKQPVSIKEFNFKVK